MPQDEQVDVIDADGNFVEVVAKKVAHEKGLLHKCVIGVLIDSKSRYLLVRPVEGRQDAGQYVFPVGGHVSSSEDEVDALRRETNEEIGVTGDFKCEFVGKKVFNRFVIGRQENHFFILYKIFSDQEPTLGYEDQDSRYFTEDELKKELKDNPKAFGEAFIFVVKAFFPDLH